MHRELRPDKSFLIIPLEMIALRFLTLDYSSSVLHKYVIKSMLL